jgi:hypothetical protein
MFSSSIYNCEYLSKLHLINDTLTSQIISDGDAELPVTVSERSNARSEAGIVGSNPTQDMDV